MLKYSIFLEGQDTLTQLGRVTHTCVSKLTIIGSDNGLSPGRLHAIIWDIAGILLSGPLGTNLSKLLSEIRTSHSRRCIWKCRLRNGDNFVSASCVMIQPFSVLELPIICYLFHECMHLSSM